MLKLTGITKTFNEGTINEKKALQSVDLNVKDGDFITIIGSNGAGKSTLLNCIAGTIMPDRGRILLNDTDLTYMPEVKRSRYIGRVFQDPMMGTAPDMWIQENLALAARRTKRATLRWGLRSEEEAFYKEQLAGLGLGLENRLKSRVGLLSGGQRQAVTLLMATLERPQLLLLDEHTAALDPKTADTVLQLSDRIVKENGLTTLMVTHNMKNAIDYGNRLIMMHDGRIILDIEGEEKQHLTVETLLKKFEEISGEGVLSDRAILG